MRQSERSFNKQMLIQSKTKKSSNEIILYNLHWHHAVDPAHVEMHMIRKGGRYQKANGEFAGEDLIEHFIKFQKLIFPEKLWHRWNTKQTECYLKYRTIVVLGPASSGKTNSAATDVLADYLAWPDCTTVLACSTTKERLEDRVWGEIKKYHRAAKRARPWMAGNLIEGRQRIITDGRMEAVEGRDFRNGMIGVPCKKGGDYVGLGDFAGIKNKRVRLLGDELSLLPRAFVDAVSNLDKNPDFKAYGLGNPKDTMDALGVMGEPAVHLGGWDGGIDQGPGTKTWPTRRDQGVSLQLPGSDSPNLDGKLGIPLITQADIDRDVSFYGKDSLWFTMMNEGRMPRGQGARRVLTRQMCEKFNAKEEPMWRDTNRRRVTFLDAAYRGVGGDRCIFGELVFGDEAVGEAASPLISAIANQGEPMHQRRQIIQLVDTVVVPINATIAEEPEDQIVKFVMAQCIARGIPPEDFFFDSGMRTALVQAFSRLWSPNVNSVDCGGEPTKEQVSSDIQKTCKEYYSKFITQLWFSVRLAVEASQVRGFTDDVISEFSQREWTIVGANKIEVEPKAKMKEKTGRSPDLADGVAIGFYGAIAKGFRIKRVIAKDQRKGRDNWKDIAREQAKELWKSGELNHAA